MSPPAEIPDIMPDESIAFPFLILQIPPEVVSVSVILEPVQTLSFPEITPGLESGITVTTFVAVATPHELLIE